MIAKPFRAFLLFWRDNERLLYQKHPKFRDFLTGRFFLFALLLLGMLVASLFLLRPLIDFLNWYVAQVPGLIGVICLFMAMFAAMSFLNSPVRADGEIPTLRDMAVRISFFAASLLGIFGAPLLLAEPIGDFLTWYSPLVPFPLGAISIMVFVVVVIWLLNRLSRWISQRLAH